MEPLGMFTHGMSLISQKVTSTLKLENCNEIYFLEEIGFTKDEINSVYKKNKLVIPFQMASTFSEDMAEPIKYIADNNFFFTDDPMNTKNDPIISNHYAIFRFFEAISDDRFNINHITKKLQKIKEKSLQ